MREILNQPSDDEDDDSDPTPYPRLPGLTQSGQSNFVICPPELFSNKGSVLKHPSRSHVHSLYLAFVKNVESNVKMLHEPSLRRYLLEETGELDCSPGPNGWNALKFAIYYIATTSLTSDECLQRLGEEKAVLLPRFRSSTELALARADFVNTEEMSTLQALVLYLVSCSFTPSRCSFWSVLTSITPADWSFRKVCHSK